MKKTTVAKFLPFIMMASEINEHSEVPMEQPVMNFNSYVTFGWNGFTGSNADKKKHFNKKRHGKSLKRIHRRVGK